MQVSGFKNVGHKCGDACISQVAKNCRYHFAGGERTSLPSRRWQEAGDTTRTHRPCKLCSALDLFPVMSEKVIHER
ncbi:hypothetical protein S83_004765 [Arachis hypogaea]